MSAGESASGQPEPPEGGAPGPQPSEEELRAQLEEELKQIDVRDIVLQTVVSLVNLGFQRLGLTSKDEQVAAELRDLGQARMAIEGVRALLPVLEGEAPEELRPVRDALSQLQLAYAQVAGAGSGPGGGEPGGGGEGAGKTGPREAPAEGDRQPPPKPKPSGRLWTPPGSAG